MAENRTVEKRIAEEQKDRGSFADDVDENKETEQPMAESSEEDAPSPHKKKQKKAATEDSRNEEEEHDEIVLKAVPRSIQEQQPPKPTDPPRGTKVFCWGVTSASHYDEPISALPFYSAWPTFLRAMPPTVSSILARYDIAVQRPIDITALFFKTRDISDIAIGKHFLSIISQNTLFICSEAGPFKRSRICNQIPITQNSPFLWTLPEYCGPQVLGPTKPELITNGMALVLKHPAGLALEADMSSATITLQSSDISSSVPATSTLSPYPKFEIMRAPWAKQIFMGRKTVFVLATDGSVFARGSNASYQLGIGNRGQDSSENRRSICHYVQEFTLVTSLFERDVVSMAGASYYSVALTSDGHVFLAGTTISLGTHHIFTEYIPEYQKKIVQEARTATAHPVALAATDAFFVILFCLCLFFKSLFPDDSKFSIF